MTQSTLILPLSFLALTGGTLALVSARRILLASPQGKSPTLCPQAPSCVARVMPEDRNKVVKDDGQHSLMLSKTESGIVKKTKNQHGAMKVCLRLEIAGPTITVQQAEVIVRALQERHPILRCRLQEVEKDVIVLANEKQNSIPVLEMDGGFREVWARIEKEPIWLNDPIFRVVLSSSSPSSTDVLLICHHAFCDGKSISSLAADFMQLLAAPESALPALGYGPPLETATSETNGKGLIDSLRQTYRTLGAMLPVMRIPKPCSFPVQCADIRPADLSAACSTAVNYLDFDAEQTRRLVQVCRQESTTVTGALAAAIVDALGATADAKDDAVVLGCGLDLRPWYTPPMTPNDLGYHVGATAMLWRKHREDRGRSDLWTLAQEFRGEIVQSITSGCAMAVATLIADMTYHSPPTSHNIKLSSSLSNWGVLPLRRSYGAWELLDARPAVNMTYLRLPVFLVTTACDRLTLTLLAPEPAYDPALLQRLLAGVNLRVQAMMA